MQLHPTIVLDDECSPPDAHFSLVPKHRGALPSSEMDVARAMQSAMQFADEWRCCHLVTTILRRAGLQGFRKGGFHSLPARQRWWCHNAEVSVMVGDTPSCCFSLQWRQAQYQHHRWWRVTVLQRQVAAAELLSANWRRLWALGWRPRATRPCQWKFAHGMVPQVSRQPLSTVISNRHGGGSAQMRMTLLAIFGQDIQGSGRRPPLSPAPPALYCCAHPAGRANLSHLTFTRLIDFWLLKTIQGEFRTSTEWERALPDPIQQQRGQHWGLCRSTFTADLIIGRVADMGISLKTRSSLKH